MTMAKMLGVGESPELVASPIGDDQHHGRLATAGDEIGGQGEGGLALDGRLDDGDEVFTSLQGVSLGLGGLGGGWGKLTGARLTTGRRQAREWS